jgi:hypothetical protein
MAFGLNKPYDCKCFRFYPSSQPQATGDGFFGGQVGCGLVNCCCIPKTEQGDAPLIDYFKRSQGNGLL